MKNSSLRGPVSASVAGSSPKTRREPGARVSSCPTAGTTAVASDSSDRSALAGSGSGPGPRAGRSTFAAPAPPRRPRPWPPLRCGGGGTQPSGVTLDDVASPSSPTCTSTTTTVMLSAPPCSLAASTSRCAASPGSSTSPQDVGHLVDPDLVGQAVRAQEHAVAGAQLQLPHVGLDLGGHAEGAGEDVALGMDGRLLLGHLAVAHALLGQAVVVGDLGELAAGEDVGPGVTDVGQRQHVPALGPAHQRHGGERRPHAAEVGVGLALVPDRGVGLREGLAQPLDRRRPLEGLLERLDGDPRRHLAADVAAHAVGDRVEVRALERQVLVDGADPPDVGGRSRPQHRQRETSKTVEPIWSRSPLPEPHGLRDLLGVDERPVGRAEVLDPELVVAPEEAGVERRRVDVLGHGDPAAGRAPDGQLVVEVVACARRARAAGPP